MPDAFRQRLSRARAALDRELAGAVSAADSPKLRESQADRDPAKAEPGEVTT
jgi:hypothetical protein